MQNCVNVCTPFDPPDNIVIFTEGADYTAVTLSLAQINLSDGTVDVKIPFQWILPGGNGAILACVQDAVAQVDTITPTGFPNDSCCGECVDYGITLKWKDECGRWIAKNYSVNLCGTQTATTVGNALRDVINADANAPVDASGTTTIILTAKVAGEQFITTITDNVMSLVHTTANTVAIGTAEWMAELAEKYGINTDRIDPSAEYELFVINSLTLVETSSEATTKLKQFKTVITWVLVEYDSSDITTDVLTPLCAALNGSATAANYWDRINATCPCA